MKALDTMNKTNANNQSKRGLSVQSSTRVDGGVAQRESDQDPSVSVSEAIQRLHENHSAMPWVKLTTAGLPEPYQAVDSATNDSGDVTKDLEKWIKKCSKKVH